LASIIRVVGREHVGKKRSVRAMTKVFEEMTEELTEEIIDDTTNLLYVAGRRVATEFDSAAWAGWIVYILGVLQDEVNEKEYTDFLRSLQARIADRLSHPMGWWV